MDRSCVGRPGGRTAQAGCDAGLRRSGGVLHGVHIRATDAKCPVGTFCRAEPVRPGRDERTDVELQGRVHLDRRHRADRAAAVEDEDPRRRGRSAGLELRRVQHQPGARRPLGLRAEAGLLVPRPHPGREPQARPVRGLPRGRDPHETNERAKLRPIAEQYADQESWYGIEQEYTFFKDGKPLGSPSAATRPRRAATTAAWAPTRCSGATSSSGTWTRAWTLT